MKSPVFAVALVALLAACGLSAQEVPPPVPARTVAFSADGKLLAIGYGMKEIAGGVLIWDVAQRRSVLHFGDLRAARGAVREPCRGGVPVKNP